MTNLAGPVKIKKPLRLGAIGASVRRLVRLRDHQHDVKHRDDDMYDVFHTFSLGSDPPGSNRGVFFCGARGITPQIQEPKEIRKERRPQASSPKGGTKRLHALEVACCIIT